MHYLAVKATFFDVFETIGTHKGCNTNEISGSLLIWNIFQLI